ncbi:hypothetical protein N7491_005479 [Penicillium cf. griseofulvum]|uniref:Uncharacterized protein n=1 Tax=Penicillium cf. griseofulvum TaxID=2972120 RepID=A0A9W9J2I5_9EURO|nr:hypothetical protein N7472_008169 [Penicillium cf. griseofulvum]KAJ5434884.1 hypothetical protein N7491_005479 [Penicillium cf. griseofulvum]KAJ5452716.1 hypothetical protein N7445_000899 [Penicillium cf. griseofulvum]
MAPIPGLANNTLSPRTDNNEVNIEKEYFVMELVFGMIIGVFVVFLGCKLYFNLKSKHEENWKSNFQDYKKYEGWKKTMGAWHGKEPKKPEPAHVASHVSEAPEAKPVTRDLTPEYMGSTVAIV